MELDFTGLLNIANQESASEEHTGNSKKEEQSSVPESEKGLESQNTGSEGDSVNGVALAKLNREQEDHQKTLEIYKEYQENTKACSLLKSEILKGMRAGEDTDTLLLKACKALSLATHDPAFYTQMEEDLRARQKKE